MDAQLRDLHTCLCFLALPHKEKLAYLLPPFPCQPFEWREGRIETDDSLRVITMITSDESMRRFQSERAGQALGAIFAILELMAAPDAAMVWSAREYWKEDDPGFLGTLDIWDGLRHLALIALNDLGWPIAQPPLSCHELLLSANSGFRQE